MRPAKPTKAENQVIAKLARHAIAKTSLDISELNISCVSGGQIELTGKIKLPRGHSGDMNVRAEFESLKDMIRNSRGVREVHGDRVIFP